MVDLTLEMRLLTGNNPFYRLTKRCFWETVQVCEANKLPTPGGNWTPHIRTLAKCSTILAAGKVAFSSPQVNCLVDIYLLSPYVSFNRHMVRRDYAKLVKRDWHNLQTATLDVHLFYFSSSMLPSLNEEFDYWWWWLLQSIIPSIIGFLCTNRLIDLANSCTNFLWMQIQNALISVTDSDYNCMGDWPVDNWNP